jgi:putative protease
LLPGDLLRLGYEDQAGHSIKRIARSVPKGGRMHVNPSAGKRLAKGAPVFLTDRREKFLDKMIADLQGQLDEVPAAGGRASAFKPALPKGQSKRTRLLELAVYRTWPGSIPPGPWGVWLTEAAVKKTPNKMVSQISWWLPPVIWPENENQINSQVQAAVKKGARHFVLNAAWQIGFFDTPKKFNLWAGPFCNLANPLAIAAVEAMGFNGVIVSPELGAEDYLQLPQQSPIPLGIVIAGHWPLGVARSITPGIQLDKPFASPRGEQAWVSTHGPDYWIYPNWQLDLRPRKKALQQAGYTLLVDLIEPVPNHVKLKKRPGVFNWDHSLK